MTVDASAVERLIKAAADGLFELIGKLIDASIPGLGVTNAKAVVAKLASEDQEFFDLMGKAGYEVMALALKIATAPAHNWDAKEQWRLAYEEKCEALRKLVVEEARFLMRFPEKAVRDKIRAVRKLTKRDGP